MTAGLRLEETAWLKAPALARTLQVLSAGEGATRVVGGAVRNSILGEPIADVDLATVLVPNEVVARAEGAGMKTVPTGIEHGTVTIIADHHPFEVTTLREDVETDGRRAVVQFGTDWEQDARRRDFTLNAIYCGPEGEIFDPVGGYEDALARRIRFVGEARSRIEEDYLRILRFFRFHAVYGHGRPDADGLRAAAALKEGIAGLSAERVWSELKRILAAPEPRYSLRWMRTTGVLQLALPESERWGIDLIDGLVSIESAVAIAPDPLLRLAAIVPPQPERMEALARRLRLSNGERARLVDWALAETPPAEASEPELRAILYRAGARAILDRLILAMAAQPDDGRLRHAYETALRFERPDMPVAGKDLVARGMTEGPEVGEALKRLEQVWIDSDFTLTRDELLALL